MGRSRTNTLVLAGVALTVLLGVVAFVARGHSAPSGASVQNRGASQVLANTMFTVWFVVMAIGAVLLVVLMAQGRHMARQQKQGRRAAGIVFIFVILFLIALSGSRFHLFHFRRPHHPGGIANLQNALKKAEQKREEQHKVVAPTFQWPLAAGIIALVIGAALTALLRAKARRDKLATEVELVREFRRVLDDYARMERILAVHGLPRRPSEAPQEYLERVLTELHVTERSVEKLTELFTRAKFSHHEVDPQMKEDAIDALVKLREQVRPLGETIDKPPIMPPEVKLTAL